MRAQPCEANWDQVREWPIVLIDGEAKRDTSGVYMLDTNSQKFDNDNLASGKLHESQVADFQ